MTAFVTAEETAVQNASPWHAGERRLQEAVGAGEKMAEIGRRFVRDHMPDQHRDFYAQLPFLLVGAVDQARRPWASILVGGPGFAASRDPKRLRLETRLAPEDPAAAGLRDGEPIGLLGVELHSRRRNRVNGRVTALDAEGATLEVRHSFGNCPQYIQTREVAVLDDAPTPAAPVYSETLSRPARDLIAKSDAFFVASFVDLPDGERQVDVSHRGGKAGFVRIGDDGLLTIPDFAGNLFFNTLGNIVENGRAGLLFIDFETGDLLQLSGEAEVLLDSPEIAAFQGAERLWTFRATKTVLRRAAIPLRWSFQDWSPNALMTGSWAETAARLEAEALRDQWRPFRIAAIQDEAKGIRSFTLAPADAAGLAPFLAGQHLPIRLPAEEGGAPSLRTYTLSVAPSDGVYRISVKKDGAVSTALHQRFAVGDLVEAQAPRGGFTVDPAERRPLVLLSAGVGVTPMLAMLRHVVYEGARTRRTRRTFFVQGARSLAERPFAGEIAALVSRADGAVTAVTALSAPEADAVEGRDYDAQGRVDLALLKRILPFDDFDFMLCGPGPFMQSLYDGLREMGVRDRRIFAEAFGPSALTRSPDGAAPIEPAGPPPAEGPVAVTFSASAKEARWTPESGSLLELAEARGLNPPFSCRGGSCGSCRTKIVSGRVSYPTAPSAEAGEDEALICCAVPAADQEGARLTLEI